MASRRFSLHRCKIFFAASLVLFLLGVCVLMYYTECIGTPCEDRNSLKGVVQEEKLAYFANSPAREFKKWERPVLRNNPPHWPGENGKAVIIGKEEETLKNELFKLNLFNLLASDQISVNRSIPDSRIKRCKTKVYPDKLPMTSIVIVFHNEAWSTLLRTIHSIIRTSPRQLLEEIILVDDYSERDYLKEKLEDYISKLEVPVKVLRTGKRSGLTRARLQGAAETKGQIITFLDAHCECSEGWLEPLLSRIAEDKSRVVCPIIDVISDETFEYIPVSDITYGGFNWKLSFRWYKVPQREIDRRDGDRTKPIRSPTMAGGLFSIDKDYFEYIGKYDEGMDIWGSENLELSFRIWMCGGTLEVVPCSHVGHVFRSATPYTFPGGESNIIYRNIVRLVSVWLDEWKDFYYMFNPGAKRIEVGDITARKQLREKLKCKSFRWYLENIFPESQMPLNYYYLGEIKNLDSGMCLDTFDRNSGEDIAVAVCHGMGGNQVFVYTKQQQIMSDENCLDAASTNAPVKLIRCTGLGGNQMWIYDTKDQTIRHMNTGNCLTMTREQDVALSLLRECDGNIDQKWLMQKNYQLQSS